jgi:hypothetical protein
MRDRVLVTSPGARIDQFEIEIDVWRQVIPNAKSGELLNELIIGFADQAIGGPKWSIALAGTTNSTAETDIISIFRADTHVGTNPEISDIEISTDPWVK